MRAIEAGLRCLSNQGVKYVFGIPAGSINALYDALLDLPEMQPIVVKHETSAGYMAAAYARISGIPSICVGSSGPGATNLVTAAANAWKEKLPVIFITGAVPVSKFGKGGAQELFAEDIFSSITKYNRTVMDAKKLPAMLAEAFHISRSGVPGPVHLSIPIDIQMTEIGVEFVPDLPKQEYPLLDEARLFQASEMIHKAGSRGVLLLGYGAKSAKDAVRKFAESSGWRVATTPRGKGAFPENHPLALGVYGLAGNEQAISYLNGNAHELVLVLGSSLGELATSNWSSSLIHNKKLIHVDYDPHELGKNYIPDLPICGDISEVIYYLLDKLTTEDSLKAGQPLINLEPADQIHTEWNTLNAIKQIGALAPKQTRFYIDIGEFMTYAIQNLTISEHQDFDININFGGMGSGIGGAIGAQLAERERPVICITGDGCFFMHGFEVLTAKEYGLPVLFVVINNARLGMVYHGHMLQYYRCHSDFSQNRVDIAAVASTLGVRYSRICSHEDFQHAATEEWMTHNGPMIVEIVVDGNEIPPMGERVKFLQGATY
jgi:acetolactate synthase I/II/III large subunit